MVEIHTIGIDFGTTYSCVGAWIDGGVTILPNSIGERTTPSVVIFNNEDEYYVGEETFNHVPKEKSVKIYEIKRFIGKTYDEIKDIIKYFPFKIVEKNGKPVIRMTFDNGKTEEYSPEYIATLIFKKLISNAEAILNQKITNVVITVPADFNNTQRRAVRFAVESINEIKVLQIINEPSAASLAAGYLSSSKIGKNVIFDYDKNHSLLGLITEPMKIKDSKTEIVLNENPLCISIVKNNNKTKDTNGDVEEKHIIVFDLGGGTYDVSLIEVSDSIFETISTAGNQMLGGDDFDNKLMEYCIDKFSSDLEIDQKEIKKNYISMQILKIECEQTKKFLSSNPKDNIYIENFYKEETLNVNITRETFEKICKDYFEKLIPPLDSVISDAKNKNINKFDEIILVGGCSKIPKIKKILSDKFPSVPINNAINPDEAVAFGATIFCEKKVRSNNELLKNFNYIDCTQHSYGVEVEDGKMEILIPKGSKYPISNEKYYHNSQNYQKDFLIKVYEGENKFCKDNKFLDKFTLENIPRLKKGELICVVNFSIDINQILKVTAYVADNKVKNGIIIKCDNPYTKKERLNLKDSITFLFELNDYEKKLKNNLIDYSNSFKMVNNDNDKYSLIKNFNSELIKYLNFLEEKCYDIASDKYIYFVENLFISYCYFYMTNIFELISNEEKIEIENNTKKYLKKISIKKPFRLKKLLMNFENIDRKKFDIFYSSSIFCMELLKEKSNKYFNIKEKNSSLVAKNLFEECLNIGKLFIKDDLILNLINSELKNKFQNIKEECDKNIKLISSEFFDGIENTKKTGNLFSDNNIDEDNLNLLSFNFSNSLKKINSINNLSNNKEALESKCICLANIVKIEFKIKKSSLIIQNLIKYADECIDILDKLGNDYKKKNWYNEILELKKEMEKSSTGPAPIITPNNSIDDIRKEFQEEYLSKGEEEFLEYIVKNYPFEEYNCNYDIRGQYNKNRRLLIKRLHTKYQSYSDIPIPLTRRTHINDDNKKEVILEFLGKMLSS